MAEIETDSVFESNQAYNLPSNVQKKDVLMRAAVLYVIKTNLELAVEANDAV